MMTTFVRNRLHRRTSLDKRHSSHYFGKSKPHFDVDRDTASFAKALSLVFVLPPVDHDRLCQSKSIFDRLSVTGDNTMRTLTRAFDSDNMLHKCRPVGAASRSDAPGTVGLAKS